MAVGAAAPPVAGVERLAALARVWARVKYVHPAMATSRIDWDAALVRAIPAVEAARSDEEYVRAIEGLLAELGDPATRLVPPEPPSTARDAPAGPGALHLEPVDVSTAVLTVPNEPSLEATPNLRAVLCRRFDEAARFDRVVLDLRSPSGRAPGWELTDAIVKCASRLVAQDVTLPPARYLQHGFYMMQGVTGGPGGGLGPWDSGLQVVSSGSVRGEGTRTPRLAFVVGRGTADVYPLLMGLQAHGLGAVVQQGDLPDAGVMVERFEAADGLEIAVRHGEWLRPGGSGFEADAVVPEGSGPAARREALALLEGLPAASAGPAPLSSAYAYAAFVEEDHSESPYPDRAHRLLALFRLYAAIEYFFPYRDLMDQPWGDTLVEFVPRMVGAGDATDYALAVAELATRIQDSHVTLSSPVLDAYFGTHRPAVRVDHVEEQTVVTRVDSDVVGSELLVGDVVVSVDGEEAAARRERLGRYLPASTRGRLENKIDLQLLLGPPSQPAAIAVRGADGRTRHASLPRSLEGLPPRSRPRSGPVYEVLAQGFGYVDLGRLDAAEVDAAFQAVRDTPGLILDMRGSPARGARALVPRLAQEDEPSTLVGIPRYEGRYGSFWLDERTQTDPRSPPAQRYTGRLAVLVDGSSQSAAEHICALIRSSAPATFVGSRTSGANGGVTRTILPGGITVNFTGYSVRHADGSRLQRVGIVPDVELHPTLRGIREGRDEVLERAVRLLEEPR